MCCHRHCQYFSVFQWEETGEPGENTRLPAERWPTLPTRDQIFESSGYVFEFVAGSLSLLLFSEIFAFKFQFFLKTDIRLEGVSNPYVGAVEVFHNGIWGRVLSNDESYVSVTNARIYNVVCHQMNYPEAIGELQQNIPIRNKKIWVKKLQCNGNEENLDFCQYYGWGDLSLRETLYSSSQKQVKVICRKGKKT